MNGEKFGRKWWWRNLSYYPNIYLEGLRKATKDLSEDSRYSGRNSNQVTPKYKSEQLPLELTCFKAVFFKLWSAGCFKGKGNETICITNLTCKIKRDSEF
jgi:hypothetical protein